MVVKGSIVQALGEHKLVLPKLVNEGLAANDRVKYRFTLLQAARRHADRPTEPLHGLHAERLQAGVDDPSLDAFAAEAMSLGDGRYRMPGAARLVTAAVDDIRTMLAPVLAAADAKSPERRTALTQRADALFAAAEAPGDDVVTGAFLDALTHGQRERGDSLHLLVMDLHKALNGLQREVASEVLDGASVYDIEDADRPLVQAFMRGVRRTSSLRFDHPGLGTTATRSGPRLVLQNDIGMTDAHVLVVHVEGLECAVTYTDVHLQRLVFFQSLFERWPLKWDDTRSVRDRQMEDGLYHLAIGRYVATDTEGLARFLEFLGSRIVFLIDWNKARKRLRNLVGRSDALALLRWAAEHDLGHMAFLRLGGDQLVFDALEFAARGQAHFGQRLEDLLGGERTVRFLQFVLRTAAEGLLQGQPESLLVDEVRAELLRHFRGSGQGLLDLVCEHAALVVELATAVRDALVELHRADGAERALELARAAKRWETEADRVLNQARSVGLASDDSRFLKSLIERADDIADDLEEAAFQATLIAAAGIDGELLQALTALADLVVQGSQELVKALETVRVLQPGAPREDTRDFLEAIHRIAVLEHDTDTARRHVASLLVHGGADARQVLVASECAQRLEVAGDDLLHVGLMLRDFVLGGAGPR